MPFIPKEKISEILSKTNIVDVIGSYLPLQKKGNTFLAICPFHEDSKPSLNISEEKQMFKCFSCNEGGNAITFVKNFNNVSFQEACKILADKVGVPLEVGEAVEPHMNENKRLFDLLKEATNFASYELVNDKDSNAYQYVLNRLNADIIEKQQIGVIRDEAKLIAFLEAHGYTKEEMRTAGILNEYDRSFLNERIAFPIRNAQGDVCGFSARTLDPNNSVKYINSRESDVFKKSSTLFNLKDAIQSAKIAKEIIVMEGFTDVLKADTEGIRNAVALMGTSLTKEHIKALRSLNVTVNLCLDGDSAGVSASLKHYQTLKAENVPVKITFIPDGLDPGDLIDTHSSLLSQCIKKAGNILDYRLLQDSTLSTFEEKQVYTLDFLKDLTSMDDPLAEDFYISNLSKKTQFTKEAISSKYVNMKVGKKPKKVTAYKTTKRKATTEWNINKVKINFAVKDRPAYQKEVGRNFDEKKAASNVIAFNEYKIMDRKDILDHYIDQKGKMLETTITLITNNDVDAQAQNVVAVAANKIAESLGIPRKNLDYVAFLHLDTKYPHIHLQCHQKEAYLQSFSLSSKLVETLQEEISNEMQQVKNEVNIEVPRGISR